MALRTQGFALSALPQAPSIPSNIGVVDPQKIYDATVRALQVGDAISMAANNRRLALAQNELATQTADAGVKRLPFATQADIAQNQNLAGLNTPDVTALRRNQLFAQGFGDISGNINRGNVNTFLGQQPIEQQAATALTGKPPTTESGTVQRDANGNIVSTSQAGVNFGDKTVPTNTSTSTIPGGVQLTPLPSAGGISPGTVIQTIGQGGKINTEVAQTPRSLFTATISSPIRAIGPEVDPQTGQLINDQYEVMKQTPVGIEPTGTILKVPHGSPAPGQMIGASVPQGQPGAQGQPGQAGQPAQPVTNAASSPFTGRINAEIASKNRMEALNDVAASAESTNAMQANIQNAKAAVEQYNKDAILPNAVRGKLGFLPSVQAVNAAKSQFVSDIMGKLRGAGRVTQQEVQYASAAYPDPSQAESVQNHNIEYLTQLSDTIAKRRAYEYNAIKDGLLPSDAKIAAIDKFRIAPPPAAGASATPVSTAAPAATATNATIPEFGSEQEAEAAAKAGTLTTGQKVKIGGVTGTWQ